MNEGPRKSPRFLSVEQAAQELNVSDAEIRSLLRSGELRGFQAGGRGQWRTGIDDLQAYIDEAYRKIAEKVARSEFHRRRGGKGVRAEEWSHELTDTLAHGWGGPAMTVAACADAAAREEVIATARKSLGGRRMGPLRNRRKPDYGRPSPAAGRRLRDPE